MLKEKGNPLYFELILKKQVDNQIFKDKSCAQNITIGLMARFSCTKKEGFYDSTSIWT